MKNFLIASLVLLVPISGSYGQSFDAKAIRSHIKTLADDSFEGRGSGTFGEKAAAGYIVMQVKKLNLEPGGDSKTYLQSFPFKGGAHGEGEAGAANNVVAYLDNQAATTVIIGAHYD